MSEGKQVKRLDFNKPSFMANGHKYIWAKTLSMYRWEEFEKLQPRVGFGVDFQGIWDATEVMWKYMNEQRYNETIVLLHNLREKIKEKLAAKSDAVYLLCSLFIVRENEDQTKFDENEAAEKIKDWKEEGYASEDFFTLAFNFVGGLLQAYNKDIEGISEEAVRLAAEERKKHSNSTKKK